MRVLLGLVSGLSRVCVCVCGVQRSACLCLHVEAKVDAGCLSKLPSTVVFETGSLVPELTGCPSRLAS